MSRKLFYVLYLLVLLEIASLLGLQALQYFKQIEYRPILGNSLLLDHRLMLEKFHEGTFPFIRFNPHTGWSPREDQNHLSGDILYSTDTFGFRKTGNTSPGTEGVAIACFGDSFTHGDEVDDAETYPAHLEQLSGISKVFNAGIPGGDPGQALSYYQELTAKNAFEADIVLFGAMTENIRRLQNVFRPFYQPSAGLPFVKPLYQMTEKGLELKASYASVDDYGRLLEQTEKELRRLGRDDWYYKHSPHLRWFDVFASVRLFRVMQLHWFPPKGSPILNGQYNIESLAFQRMLAVLQESVARVESRGKKGVVILLPTRRELHREVLPIYTPLRLALQQKGVKVIDVRDCILQSKMDHYVMPGGHYVPAVNKHVAQCIYDFLRTDNALSTKNVLEGSRIKGKFEIDSQE